MFVCCLFLFKAVHNLKRTFFLSSTSFWGLLPPLPVTCTGELARFPLLCCQFLSKGCCYKLSKTVRIDSFTVLEAKPSKSRCQQSRASLEGSQKRRFTVASASLHMACPLWVLVMVSLHKRTPLLRVKNHPNAEWPV